ncbi:tetratricopeptide repeat protein [Lentzea sp. NPDC006480]|uniref:tetratricopeptide repeat protein n=1 Tax=Lentzea sp. NPDC006480 TaxID=3157176 RepID=UPI0033A35079
MSMDAHSSVRGTVHGPVTQLGNVRGDVHISTSPGVSWPVHVGVVPRRADCYQDRPAPVSSGLTVFRGMGGVGKTQSAAHHARTAQQSPDIDLVVWITATTREAVVAGYAEAATLIQIATPDTDAAALFLTWLQTTPRRWLIVLDDLADPSVLRDLWPPTTGQTLVTTRRRDSSLARTDSSPVDITVFTAEQSQAYLDAKLAAHAHLSEGASELAQVLGHLPLALAQAVAYLTDRNLTCAAYVSRFRDQRRKLGALVPEPSALPDDHQATIDVTWSLSIELANSLAPTGLAKPLLQIASLLDPNGIPVAVLTSPPVTALLETDAETAADALHCLQRLSLTEPSADSVTVHALVQRATHDDLTPEDLRATSQTAADALQLLWPDHEGMTPLLPSLRANVSALTTVALPELVGARCHPLLFTYGEDLGKAGLFTDAQGYYARLLDLAAPHLGGDHTDVLFIRNNMTVWRGEAGDMADSIEELGRLVDDCTRVLGPDHSLTLSARGNRASRRLAFGDTGGAAKDFEDLLADQARILGPDARDTLLTRGYLAHCRTFERDLTAAAREFEQLLADQLAVLGADHPDTLGTRNNLASCKSAGIDATGAVADYEALLADQIRVLGPEHTSTLALRANLAVARGVAGDAPAAVEEFEGLLDDMRRILGPVHPHTLSTRSSLADWRGKAGQLEASLREQELVLHDCVRVLGPLHPTTLASRYGLARLRGTAGDPVGAARELKELVADQRAALGADNPDTLLTRFNAAASLLKAGDLPGAIREFELLADDQSRVLGVKHPDTLSTRSNLAAARAHAGDFKKAITEFTALVKDHAEIAGADHVQTLTARLHLTKVLGTASQFTKAIRICEPLLADQVRVLGPEHDDTLETRQLLANLRYQTGDAEGAAEELEQLLAALSRVLMPTHDRITKLKREIAFLKR